MSDEIVIGIFGAVIIIAVLLIECFCTGAYRRQ